MATSISSPSTSSILVNQWTNVYSFGPVNGFSGTVRIVVEVGNGTIKLANNATGVTAITQGYGDLYAGKATSIAFEGSLTQVNNALLSLQAFNADVNATPALKISAVKAGSAYNPDNGHYYQAIYYSGGIGWLDAKTAAASAPLKFNGLQGYLATITSAKENEFILNKLPADAWIGATDKDKENYWKWDTGPEAGQEFWYWNGSAGVTVSGRYHNWNSNEPNDSKSHSGSSEGEDYGQFYVSGGTPGRWNDLPGAGATAGKLNYYVVEYGGMAGDAPAEAAASSSSTLTVQARPVITSNGGATTATISYAENGTGAVTKVTASDQDTGDSKTYSLLGADADKFDISAEGVLTFKTIPNFEAPTDNGANNSYEVTVVVTDGTGLTDQQALTINVTDVNDLPVVTGSLPANIAATEDLSANVDLSALAFTDQEAAQTFTLKLAATAGTLTATGTGTVTVAGSGSGAITLTGTPANVTAYLDTVTNIQYKGAANANGNAAASIAVSYKDSAMGGFTAYGSTAVNIAAVNDAPVVVSPSLAVTLAAINEDQGNGSATGSNPGASVSSLFGPRFSDVDTGSTMSGIVVVTNTVDAAKGQWQYSTVAGEWHDMGTVSVSDGLVLSAATQVRFAPADNWFGTPSELDVKLLDNTQTTFTSGATKVAAPTTATTESTNTVNLGTTVAPVNDLPTITSDVTAASLTETGVLDNSVATASGALTGTLTVADVEGTLSFGIRGGSTSGTTITKQGFFGTLALDTATKVWTYTPSNFTAINALGEGKTATDTFDFSVADSNGATASQALTITYTGTNDVPVLAAAIAEQVFNGSGAWSYQIPANTFTDAEGTALTYTVQVVDGAGAVLDTITNATAGNASLPSNWLIFSAASRTLSGTPTSTAPLPLNIKVTASDGSASVADTFTVTLTAPTSGTGTAPANLAPVSTDDRVLMSKDTEKTLELTDFGNYQDAEGTALASVKITTLPTVGSLEYSSDGTTFASVTLGQEITAADITAGKLKFVPVAAATGADYATIGFQVGDGTDFSSSYTLTVDVGTAGTVAAAAPSISIGGTTAYTENAAAQTLLSPPLVLAITDADSTTLASATVGITAGLVAGDVLAFANDSSTMGNIAGVYADDTGVLTLQSSGSTATLAQWTAALKAVTFASSSDNPGTTRTLSWKVNDGTNDSNVGTTTIAVTEVNDAPVATKLNDVTPDSSAALSLNIGTVFTDPEGGAITYSATLADGTALPSWLSFDAGTHVFSGNPPAGVPYLDIKVIGTDASNAAGFTTFKLNLANADNGAAAANTVGTVSISGATTLGATLTATAPVDADDITGAVGYQWQMSGDSGSTWVDIGGATSSTFTITQAQSNKQVRVQALYNDDGGFAEAPVSTALTVPTLNLVGVVTVQGSPTPDEVLVASLSDGNGIVGVTPTYQWYQGASAGALTTPISGATDSSYKLTNADGGKFVSVQVSYTDNDGTAEVRQDSTDTAVQVGAVAPVAVNDTNTATEAGGAANGAGGTGGSNATGNVLTNDTDENASDTQAVAGVRAGSTEGLGEAGVLGADENYTIAGTYGTLKVKADGSYTYTVNQTAANVQALTGGQVVTDVFNYTVKDSTNKTDIGLLTITLTGADDALLAENLPASFAVTEDQKMALVMPSDLSLVDPDFSGDATITLVASAGTLSGTTGQSVTVSGSDSATLTLVGTLANISTWLSTAGNVQYTGAANANGATAATVTFNLTGGSAAVLGVRNVAITAVNDAPTSADQTVTFLEDGTYTFLLTDFAFADAADTASGTANALQSVKITTLPFYGSLTLNNVAVNQGDLVTVADISGGNLKFVSVADQNRDGYTGFTFQVQDNGGTNVDIADVNLSVTPNTFTFNVTPVNDAPVLTNAGTSAPTLVTITEDATGNAGNLISTLVRAVDGTDPTDNTQSVVTDVDFASQGSTGGSPNEGWDGGVAIYGLTNTGPADGGKWQYKLASGGGWVDVDATTAVSPTNALLLGSTDSIRFLPDGENATTATISYHIWDGSSGSAGTKVDASTRGGSTAFSTASDTATVTVTPINDAPTLDLNGAGAGNNFTTTFLPRGGEVAVVAAGITISDVDQTDRTDATKQDRISKAVVQITGGDDDNYPDLTDETLTFKDAGTATTTWNGLSISGNGGTTVTITGVADWATYQTALQKVVYNNANPTPTTGNRTIEVTVTDNDDTDALAAHTNKLTATATTTMNVASVAVVDLNGDVAGANNTVTYTEGDAGKALATNTGRIDNLGNTFIKTVVFTLSNPVDGNVESLFVDAAAIASKVTPRGIEVTQSTDTHTITLSAKTAAGVSANDMNVALRLVQYKNTSDAPNVTDRVVNVTVEDISMAGVGASSTITIVPVNDAPVISANAAATVLEGGLVTLTTTNLNATDIDDAQATLDFVVTAAPTKGVLFRDANSNNQADSGEVLSATAGTGVVTSFTQGDLAAGLVKYQQTDTLAGSATDYGSDSFAFKVQDGMENAVVAPTGTLAINITPVNDAPTLTATTGTRAFAEEAGTAVVLFSGSAISAVESGQNIGEIKLTVAGLADGADEKLRIDGQTVALQTATGTTTAGSFGYAITVSGTTATVTLTKTDTAANWQTLVDALAYQNTSTAPTTTNRTVTLTSVKDSGGISDGGKDTTALSLASTVTLTASDSAPVAASNTGASLANGGLTTLTAAKLATTDSDTSPAALVYTVGTAPTKGTLFKDLNGSGAVEAGEALTANSTFTQADIAAGLIKYRHGGADNSADNFAFTVKDGTTTLPPATFAFTFSAAGTVAGSGSTTANSTSGTDALFSGVAITPTPDHTVKTLTFAVNGVKDGGKEVLSINGQTIPMVAGTTTVDGVTYTVTETPANSGNFTVAVTDSTAPGFSAAEASAITNGVRYSNTAVPPTPGDRSVGLDSFTEMDGAGTASAPTDTNLVATTAVAPATDLFALGAAQTAIAAPSSPNDVIQTLNFAVGGVVDGANEVFKINGVEVPLVPGVTTVEGVTYTVAGVAPKLTVSVYNPAGFTKTETETLLDGATLSNTASPASAGSRTVTLESVTEAQTTSAGNPATPAGTATAVTGLSTSSATAASGTPVSPLPGATIPTIGGSTIDTLTFTVSGVKDGANEVLAIGGTNVPLVPGTYPSESGATTPGSFTVTVDTNGKATVVFTPTTNLDAAAANALVTGTTYTNSATPATAGVRDVALTNMGVDNGGGTVTSTPVTTITSAPIVLSGVTVPTLTPGAGTDLFDAIDLPQVAPGSSVKAITLGITGVQDGAKETITVNGQKIPLVNGTIVNVGGVTYVVALDASGNGTLTVTDTAAPGWNEAQAENILNNIGYQNTANPPTPGDRAIKVNEVAQADNATWATEAALTLPTNAATPNTVAVTAPVTTTPAGGQSDQLFSTASLPAPTTGSTVSELTFTVTNVKDGSNEVFTVNGQNIPLAPGSTTVDGVVYTVTVDANGTATVTVTDNTAPGFTQAKAEAIVNGAAYTNTASPATAGERVVTLTEAKEMTAAGVQTDMTGLTTVAHTVPVTGTTPTSPSGTVAVGLFTAAQAAAAIPTPTSGNDIQTLTFAVNGVKNGADEVLKINGQSIPMVAGETTVGDVTYTLVESPADSGNFTVTVTDASAPAFSEAQAEAMVSGASLSNTAATPTAGNRTVSLTSVTEASSTTGTVGATTPITGATATVSSSVSGTVNTPMAGETLPVTSGSSVDSLTFTVTGVKDGSSEVLAIGGTNVPLVPGTYPSTGTPAGSFAVAVDANGKATVVFTPTANLDETAANTLVTGVTYTNSATPPSAGAREVALSSMVEETGDGSTAGTTSTVIPTGIGSTVAVNGAPSTDVFASSVVIPAVPGGSTVDQISFGVSGVKDGANEVVQINGQSIPLVNGTTTDANGSSYTVTVDANGNATVVFTPSANLSETDANAILDGMSYTNKASPISAGARDITVNSVVTQDGSGNTTTVSTPGLTSTVPLGNVTNTAPKITVNTGLTVAEGQTFTLSAAQLAATDAQTAAGNLVFKLAAAPAHGTLFRDSNGNGLAEASEVIAANGSFTQLELTSGKIKYRHDSSETAADQLSLTVSDGTATTTAVPFGVTVTPVNDMPTLTATAQNPTFTEATTVVPVALFTAAAASTGDTLGTAQVLTSLTLTVSNVVDGNKEMLLVNGTNTIELSGTTASGNVGTVNGNNLTYTVSKSGSTATVTLTHTGLTEAELKTLVESLQYQNTSTDPTAGARAVNITQLKDNGGGTLPNLDTAYLSAGSTVTVVAANDAPTLTGTGFTVLEGGSFVLSATQLAAADGDTPLANLVYAVSTAPAAGLLYIDNNGNAVNDSGDTTLAQGSTFTQLDLTSGKVRYQHGGSESADLLLAFSVSDGTTSSSAVAVAVTLTPVNDAPTLAGLDGDVLTYPPASAAMLIDVGSNATVTDPDSSDFAAGVLRASIYFNGNASKDVLSIKNAGTAAGQIGVSGADVSYAGTVIGTVAGGSSGADLVVTLNASADKAATEALVHALQFYNSEAAPTVNSRGIRISLSDGDGGTSLVSQVQVNIPVGGPTFLSGSGFYVAENTSLVTLMAATESDTAKLPITYSISTAAGANNVDAAKFSIDASNGTLSFIAAPDFEQPADSGGNNVYNVVVRASNKEGAYTEAALAVNVVDVANESGPAPGDTTPPAFALATVNGSTLVMTYTDASNNLDATNVPPPTAFAVSGNTVTAVVVNATAKTVTLTLGTAVVAGAAVTVSYTDPTSGNDVAALQDAAGNDAVTLAPTAVTNLTPSTGTGGGTTQPTPEGGTTTTTPLPGGGTVVTTTNPLPGGGSVTTTTTTGGGNTSSTTVIEPIGGTAPVTITAPVDNAQLNLTGSGATTVDNPAGSLSVANNGSGTATVNGLNPNASLNASGTGPTQVSNPDGSLTVANNGTGAVTVMQLKPGAVLNTTGTQPVNLDLSHLVSGQTITIDNDGTGVVNLLNVPEGVIILSTGSGTGAFNYAPTLNGVPLTAQAVTAGTAADLADFTVADRDVNHSLTVTLTATNGSLSGLIDADANTAGIQLTGTASAVNTALAAAKFTATAAGAASIGISVSDGVKSATSTYHLTAAPAPQPPGPPGPPEPPKPPEPGQVDGASVTTTVTTNPEGQTVTTLVVAPVPVNRVEDGSTANPALADITLAKDSGGAALISVGLPVGVGIESETLSGGSLTLRQMLVGASQARLGEGAALSQIIQDGIDQYLPTVIDPAQITLRTLTLKAAPGTVAAGTLAQPIVITGAVGTGEASALHPHRGEALVIDARQLPAGAVLQLDNVEFAIVIGNCTVVGGSGRNFVVGDAAAQTIVLGAEDDVLHGGGGNDYIGSKGGNDQLYGDAGNDTLSGGKDNDTLHGGSGNDKLYGGQGMDTAVFTGQHSQYDVTQAFGVFTVRALSGSEGTDTLVNVERIQFADQTLDIASKAEPLSWLATLYQQVLGRQADLDGFQWWAHEAESGIGEGQVLMSFILSKERIANTGQDFNTLGTADKVEYFYNTILARPSEAAGKAWWIDQIDQNGQDLVHVAEQFMHSAELTGQYLAPQDWDFLV